MTREDFIKADILLTDMAHILKIIVNIPFRNTVKSTNI